MKTKLVQINKIMDSPPTNSGLKKKDVLYKKTDKNLLPVYSASQDENLVFGWLNKNSNWKVYKNMLTWNKDGSSGIVFYRQNEFIPYEKVKLLKIKKIFEKKLDYLFLKYIIQDKLFSLKFDFNFKCSMERVLDAKIKIPVSQNEEFNLEEQKNIANKYKKIEQIKYILKEDYEKIKKIKINLSANYETKTVLITDIFDPEKGNAKYTKKYMHNHSGKYPVYSSQTSNFGEIGKIDTYNYDEECFTWTTDGYAGCVFYRNDKFSITTHCGILRVKERCKDKFDFEYLDFILNQTLPNYKLGEGSNKRLGTQRIKEIFIKIPIKENGEFDLNKQREIADKYKKIEQFKKNLQEDYKKIIDSKVQIIENVE